MIKSKYVETISKLNDKQLTNIDDADTLKLTVPIFVSIEILSV